MHEQALKATVDIVKYYKSGHAAVMAYAEHPAVKTLQYPDHYARTRSMIRYSLILSSEGTVLPLPLALPTPAPHGHPSHHPHHPTAADIPADLHEIFTHRLPDEIYYYLSRGLLGPQALVWLSSGQIVENPPLDNGETTEYKRFVKEVVTDGQTGPRCTALALVSSVAHAFWANKKVQGVFWFDQPSAHGSKAVGHNSPQTAQLAERVTGWNVMYSVVEEELRRQNVSTELSARISPRGESARARGALPYSRRVCLLTRFSHTVVHYRLCALSGCYLLGAPRGSHENQEQRERAAREEGRGRRERDLAIPGTAGVRAFVRPFSCACVYLACP